MYAGDIESMPFIEALGQFSYRVGNLRKCDWYSIQFIIKNKECFLIVNYFTSTSGTGNFCLIHVSLVPVLNVVGEQVTILTLLLLRNVELVCVIIYMVIFLEQIFSLFSAWFVCAFFVNGNFSFLYLFFFQLDLCVYVHI